MLSNPKFTGGPMLANALGCVRTLSAAAFLLGSTTAALASNPAYEKVALIIGNSDYTELPDLPNATSDAAAVSKMLKDSGYLVFEKNDLDKSQFSASIAEISANLNSTSEVVFFFAGHGFQIGSENYLIPTNSQISGLSDVPLESISLTHVLEHLSTQSGSQVILLDSCRSNPFVGQQVYSGLGTETLRIENGFSFQSAPINSLISFSTAPGSVALDGEGDNSPYTTSLIGATSAFPEYDIASILPIVRAQVFEETQGFQVPWESSSLLKPVYLSNRGDSAQATEIALTAVTQAPDTGATNRELSAGPAVRIAVDGSVRKHIALFQHGTSDEALSADVIVAALPQNGWLGIKTKDTLRTVRLGETLSPTAAARLTYSPDLRPGRASEVETSVADTLRLHRGGTAIDVDINLAYHDCDLAAASPLDPQGLGLSVENFELLPDQALAACTQAVAHYPNESRFHYQLFRAQIAKRQFPEAEISVTKALEMGHIRANLGMGQLKLTQTKGVAADTSKPVADDVLQHYLDGHKRGDPMATYFLGRQLIRHGKTNAERQRGYALLHRSKDAGYVEALNELGRYFFVSKEGDANPQRGLQYFEEAADRNNNQGFNGLGIIYKNGLGGIDTNLEKAVTNFEAAARLGHPTAPTNLGRIWAEGKLTEPNFLKAFEWYDTGLGRGDPWGGVNAANLVGLGKIPGSDNTQVAIRAAKAAAIGTGKARQSALDLLDQLSKKELAGGLQRLLAEMGEDIGVDGVAGNQTALSIAEVYGALIPLDTKDDIVNALAKVAETYWLQSNVRVDLN